MSCGTAEEVAARARDVLWNKRPFRAPLPDHAYGVFLTNECLLRFGRMMRKQKGRTPNPDPDDEDKLCIYTALSQISPLAQVAVAGLMLTRWRTVLVQPWGDLRMRRLLVLADDGSPENRKMKNTIEIEDALIQFLGLGDQKPAWYTVCKWYVVIHFSPAVQANDVAA
ncbi:hypothetical protein HGRIS_014626 [Hohenbuehelia grisea]|uniref:Uncharacterized protein n=1 Tax=Hohenbuehelia grisea TaxID=104357 RepID=A0ABR3JU42_9AGAR